MKTHSHIPALSGLIAMLGGNALAAPTIVTQPQTQIVATGATVAFSVEATGVPPLTYQWLTAPNGKQPTDIPDATEATLVVEDVVKGIWLYQVAVTDAAGTTLSAIARLVVFSPPILATEPFDLTLIAGEDITLRVTLVDGAPPLRYQWQFEGVDLEGETRTSLALTDVQAEQEGEYSVVVSNNVGSATGVVARLSLGSPAFTLVKDDPVVTPATDSSPGKWGDYDGDGYPDLSVQSSGLYHSNGDGSFSRAAVPGFPGTENSVTWVDYDNDGDLDLTVSAAPYIRLYENMGDGSFHLASVPPITTDTADVRGFGWADFDNDGDLDFFRSNTYYQSDFLYRNNGDGSFTRLTDSPVEHDQARAYGCTWVDFDRDGAMDLYTADIGCYGGFLYGNRGDGSFVPVTFTDTGLLNHGLSIHSAWGDYDNDGDLDVLIGNRGYGSNFSRDAFFQNDGDGTFTKIIDSALTEHAGESWGAAWADYDNDGLLDIFVPNTSTWEPTEQWDNFLFHNNGDGTFTRVMDSRLNHDGSESWGASWADYDNDGFLDLFVANDEGQKDFLYHNEGNDNGWLLLKLIGTASNRSAIGAWVEVTATIAGEEVTQTRHVVSGFSYGQPDSRIHFGLGDAIEVDRLRIEWPSGTVQELTDVDARQILEVTETLPDQIAIHRQPEPMTIAEGRPAKFFAKVSGPQPLGYQWQRDGEDLPGETDRILYLPTVEPDDAGSYQLVISDESLDDVLTEPATLTVAPPIQPGTHEFAAVWFDGERGRHYVTLTGEALPGFLDIFAADASADLQTWHALPAVASDAGAVSLDAGDEPQRFFRALRDGFWTPYPAPTGPHAVGTMQRQVSNSNGSRTLRVTAWYPATRDVSKAPAPWFEPAYVGYLEERFGPGMKVLNRVHGHSIPGLALSEAQSTWPVVILSHAYRGHRADNRDLAETLASHGYIVVSANHRDAELTVLEDGTEVSGSGLLWYDGAVFNTRVTECRMLLDSLAGWNDSDPMLKQRIDLETVGVAGFSLGGEALAQLGRTDPRLRAVAVVGLEPFWCYALAPSGVAKPMLLVVEEPMEDRASIDDIIYNQAYRLFNISPGPAYYLRVGGTMHHSLTGVMRIVAPQVPGGDTDNRRAAEILNASMVSFFNKHLLGQDDHLLDAAREAIPELVTFLSK